MEKHQMKTQMNLIAILNPILTGVSRHEVAKRFLNTVEFLGWKRI